MKKALTVNVNKMNTQYLNVLLEHIISINYYNILTLNYH